MAARLGQVLFVLGLLIGAGCFVSAGIGLVSFGLSSVDKVVWIALMGVPGLAAILLGWAFRYVLSGR